jgi:Right handed beta helix region
MHVTSTARAPRRSRVVRGLTLTASAGLVVAVLPAGTAAAGTPDTWVVHAGESIQAVVDQAASGDTIQIEAGTYHEAVCIDGKGLTIVGAGRGDGGTAIVWPEVPPVVPETPCWVAQNSADPETDPNTLQDDASALFFLNPDGPVSVSALATANHPANGIAAWGADGFTVSKTMGFGHHRYGILAADSTHIRIVRNIERGGDEGTAGISVGDSDDAYAYIASNHVEDYNLGIFTRESRSGAIANNYVTENCVGILVFDDAATELPDSSRNVEAGDWGIFGNEVTRNNQYCLAGIGEVEGALRVSGTGVSVVNADYVDVEGNTITDNVPSVDDPLTGLDFPAGGLTLLSLPPFNNPPGGADPGRVENVDVTSNTITGNVPVDVLVGSPQVTSFLLDVGDGIEFEDNSCGTSVPAEVCGP